jgi:hypothetical protein
MRFLYLSFGLIAFSSAVFASVPKGCPSTRSCVENKNCSIYAFKHNCHGICQSANIKNIAGQDITCPMQCGCQKVPTTKNA